MKFQQKLQVQKGFTLLELLIVITILAALATAALVAYEGIGEQAEDTAASNNLLAAESAIRNYRAVEGVYPEQWDNLVNVDGTNDNDADGMDALLAAETKDFLGQWVIPLATHTTTPAGTVYEKVAEAMDAVGMEEIQSLDSDAAFATGVVPNLALNESNTDVTNSGSEIELDAGGALFDGSSPAAALALSIVPSSVGGAAGDCDADGVSLTNDLAGNISADNGVLNLINDSMDDDACVLVLALGFGKDLPGSTTASRVGISVAPTAATDNVNPATHYARYIGLFQVAADKDEDGTIQPGEVFAKARLVGFVDPEGRNIDGALAGANETN